MKNYISLFILLFLTGSCQEAHQLPINEFSQDDLQNYTLLDVRTPEEFEEGHLVNAININWFDDNFTEQVAVLEKEKTIYVYCQKGGRSAEARAVLDSLGFKAIDLTGGYGAWTANTGD